MKILRFSALGIVLLSALILTACGDWSDVDGNFERRLQGTWVTPDINNYIYITLTITSNTITIKDESYDWPYVDKNASTHPFKGFNRDVPFKGYSEKKDNYNGIIYIEEFGVLHAGIPYKYESISNSSSYNRTEKIQFTFPSPEAETNRSETLIKIAD